MVLILLVVSIFVSVIAFVLIRKMLHELEFNVLTFDSRVRSLESPSLSYFVNRAKKKRKYVKSGKYKKAKKK